MPTVQPVKPPVISVLKKAQVNLLGNTGVFTVLLIIQCGAQPIAGNAQHQRTGCHGSDSQHSSDQGPAGLVPLQ